MPLTPQQELILADGGIVRLRRSDRFADFFPSLDFSEKPLDRCPAFALNDAVRNGLLQCVKADHGARIWRLAPARRSDLEPTDPAPHPSRTARRPAVESMAVVGDDIGWR